MFWLCLISDYDSALPQASPGKPFGIRGEQKKNIFCCSASHHRNGAKQEKWQQSKTTTKKEKESSGSSTWQDCSPHDTAADNTGLLRILRSWSTAPISFTKSVFREFDMRLHWALTSRRYIKRLPLFTKHRVDISFLSPMNLLETICGYAVPRACQRAKSGSYGRWFGSQERIDSKGMEHMVAQELFSLF